MILVDTSELKRPTQRKLHAACANYTATGSRAPERSPRAGATGRRHHMDRNEERRRSVARTRQRERTGRTPSRTSTAGLVGPGVAQHLQPVPDHPADHRTAGTRFQTDQQDRRRCFPTTDPDDIGDHTDARIVCESMALGAKMLLTSNMRTIDHIEVNRWATENGNKLGFKAEPVLYQADATLTEWTSTPAKLERWIQAGFLACWPHDDTASAKEVIQRTLKRNLSNGPRQRRQAHDDQSKTDQRTREPSRPDRPGRTNKGTPAQPDDPNRSRPPFIRAAQPLTTRDTAKTARSRRGIWRHAQRGSTSPPNALAVR